MKLSRLPGRPLLCLSLLSLLAACGGTPQRPSEETQIQPAGSAAARSTPGKLRGKKGGGYYKDDGPADDIPDNLDEIPDAVPRWEPLHKPALKPYEVLGKRYVPNDRLKPHRERGIASWYGKKFHGQKTSIGEPYDMFAMTAAHPTLALPSYVRVTHQQSGRSVIVRVIDRGPFHAGRVIDLSYTAAYKLGLIDGGSGEVDVEAMLPGETGNTRYAEVQVPANRPSAVSTPAVTRSERPQAGVYLQLGAFSNVDNADSLKNHLARELDSLNQPLHVFSNEPWHRLQMGPFASRSEAEAAAHKINEQLGYRPTIVSR
ncbi:MAG: septal ring lytic transglycosylase RlpA family protein [Dechloromonas sp.]|nr:septal ring lytic transglycosylase RlpA family protein [Dechloromonas sp.]